jgi:hypothetical protein
MTNHIETIMRNSASIMPGWLKYISPDNNTVTRSIRIGSQSNCNEDGFIRDPTTYDKIKDIMNKYNIHDYELTNIHNKWEYSTQLTLDENNYNKFKKSICP